MKQARERLHALGYRGQGMGHWPTSILLSRGDVPGLSDLAVEAAAGLFGYTVVWVAEVPDKEAAGTRCSSSSKRGPRRVARSTTALLRDRPSR